MAAEDFTGKGWIYPSCTGFTPEPLKEAASDAGLRLMLLNWQHPRQTWGLFAKPGFDSSHLEGNRVLLDPSSISRELNSLRQQVLSLQRERTSVQLTLGWTLLTRYWQIVESLLPRDTPRRRTFDLLAHKLRSAFAKHSDSA